MKRLIFSIFILLLGFNVWAQDRAQIIRDMGLEPFSGDSIAASTLTVSSYTMSGTQIDMVLLATNNSGDLEYMDRVTVEFPVGWTVLSVGYNDLGFLTNPVVAGGAGTNLATLTNVDGLCSGWGFLGSGGGMVEMTVSVDTGVPVIGLVTIPWMMEGDTYGGTEHVLCSTSSSCLHDPCYGAAAPPPIAPGVDMMIDLDAMVPTLGQWGLVAFVVLLGLVAVVFARKKLV